MEEGGSYVKRIFLLMRQMPHAYLLLLCSIKESLINIASSYYVANTRAPVSEVSLTSKAASGGRISTDLVN